MKKQLMQEQVIDEEEKIYRKRCKAFKYLQKIGKFLKTSADKAETQGQNLVLKYD